MANDVVKLFIIVLAIDMFLFLGQHAVLNINSDASIYNSNNNSVLEIQNKGVGSNYALDDSNATNSLIRGSTASAGTQGFLNWVDPFTAVYNWFTNVFNFIGDIVFAPYHALQMMNVPSDFSFIVGAFWAVLTIILVSLLIVGRLY